MLLYMYVDGSQLEDGEYEKISAAVYGPLYDWVEASEQPVTFVGSSVAPVLLEDELEDANVEPVDEAAVGRDVSDSIIVSETDLGIQIQVKKKQHLKEPLNFLYDLAKSAKCEFVLGYFEDDGSREDACYFGFEEGRPDLYEIANYIDLSR